MATLFFLKNIRTSPSARRERAVHPQVVIRAQEAPLVHVPVAAAEGVLWLIIDRGG
jgi:hypothetical protein